MKNNKKISDSDFKKIFKNASGNLPLENDNSELDLIKKRIKKEEDKIKRMKFGIGITVLSSFFLFMVLTKETSHPVSRSKTLTIEKEISANISDAEIEALDEVEEDVETNDYAQEYVALLDLNSEL